MTAEVAGARTGAGGVADRGIAIQEVLDGGGGRTGCGHAGWEGVGASSRTTAAAVAALLEAGAAFAGKVVTDEIAYSLNGRNAHYGTPVNPAAPDRIPGGSSSGPAVATAASSRTTPTWP